MQNILHMWVVNQTALHARMQNITALIYNKKNFQKKKKHYIKF